jgi:hypothetical protein
MLMLFFMGATDFTCGVGVVYFSIERAEFFPLVCRTELTYAITNI